jgi:NAD-dependent deacetylase
MTDGAVPPETIEGLADELRAADHAVALTGAGVSTASGLPSFRGDDGIWEEEFDPAEFRYARFTADPEGFWRDRVELHEHMYGADVGPNAAHEALADLESAGLLDAVVTQNTDGLHDAAGTEAVVEIHGNAQRAACQSCGERVDAGPVYDRVRDGEVPPRCVDCGGILKPNVVLFGQQLPDGALQTAQNHAREADVFLAVGSSLTVEPAASLPRVAGNSGATVVIINLDETNFPGQADYELRADVTEVLPALVDALEQ